MDYPNDIKCLFTNYVEKYTQIRTFISLFYYQNRSDKTIILV